MIRNLTALVCLCLLTSCTTVSTQEETTAVDAASVEREQAAEPRAIAAPAAETPAQTTAYFTREEPEAIAQQLPPENTINKGSGVFINKQPTRTVEPLTEPGDITLNFEGADLREFVRVVFEDILKQNYLIDPQVKGKVTLHTTHPVTEDALLPIVESVLQLNGAAVVYQLGLFKVVPIADAPSQADMAVINGQDTLAPGFPASRL